VPRPRRNRRAMARATSTQQDPIPRRFVNRDEKWPPGHPDGHPTNAPASANESSSQELSHALSVTRADDKRRSRRGGCPLASASLYEPSCERTWWWISLRCPWCGSVHLHRVRREEDAAGLRRTGCGRRVYVKIRTIYRSNASSGVAA
jgi:hypothetical protein